MITCLKVLSLVLLLTASACVSAGTRAILEPGIVSRIEVGKSTRADVAALLGYPLVATYQDQGVGEATWHYYYDTATPTTAAFIPLGKAFTPNLRETTRVLSVTFNREGTVKSLTRQQIPLPVQQVSLNGKKS
jgi:outer membrane protein assembly factor BamE (lipoprotein component of BamABCDE complex)